MLFNEELGHNYLFLHAAAHLSIQSSANLCMTLHVPYNPLNQINLDYSHDSLSATNDIPQCELGTIQSF